jgi:hypothetical protein
MLKCCQDILESSKDIANCRHHRPNTVPETSKCGREMAKCCLDISTSNRVIAKCCVAAGICSQDI